MLKIIKILALKLIVVELITRSPGSCKELLITLYDEINITPDSAEGLSDSHLK